MVDVGHLAVFGTCVECEHEAVTSPLLDLPGAVAGDGIDPDVAAHYGSFNGEQRTLEAGEGFVDLSHRDVDPGHRPGPADLAALADHPAPRRSPPKVWTGALVLSPQGHVEHAFFGYDDGEAFTPTPSPGRPRRSSSSSTGCGS